VFQAKLRGWRRLAAGLVLVPGLTGLGADALGLVGRAAGQDRPAADNRADEARDLMRRAREAYDAQNYGLARELAEKARALRAPAAFYDDKPDDLLGDMGKKPAGRTPAAAASARPTPADPKVLTTLSKQALEAGDLDKAQDLATQAQASAGNVRWGMFDDTPSSILKDVAKARARRDHDTAIRLMTEARQLIDRQTASRNERAANLTAAEEKARQAAGLNPSFSMWDFGDRPGDLLNDARKAREKEKLVAVRGESDDVPKAMPKRTGWKTGDKAAKADEPPAKPADPTRKKAAIALMQEAKSLEVGRHYVEAKKKYVEAARLNVTFAKDEDSPESELARLNVAAQRRINALAEEARSCLERKDANAARVQLDEAHALATGMGLDASVVVELRASLKPATQVAQGDAKTESVGPLIHNGWKSEGDKGDKGDSPAPIIRTGRKPVTGDKAPEIKTAGGDEPPIAPIPPAVPETGSIIKPIPAAPAKPMTADAALPPLPMVPDTSNQADATKPPVVAAPIIRTRENPGPSNQAEATMPPVVGGPIIKTRENPGPFPVIRSGTKVQEADKGQEMLRAARAELKKGDPEAARKIAIDLINGPYDKGCQDEAKAILASADTKQAEQKIADAKRAFEKAQEVWVTGNRSQALAIFKQIDGALLTGTDRKVMASYVAAAEAEEAKRQVTTEKLPTAPKTPAGIPDLPPTKPAPAPMPRTGADNLIQQQDALAQVEFQRLRTKALRVESEATARFGRGETDEALMDLQNLITEVKASKLEPNKQAMLCRPVEARMDRLRILKHQTDFLTKESRRSRDFKAEMTHEALDKEKKHEEVAKLMKEANKLGEEHKYKEAYAKLQMAQTLDPDDASVNGAAQMAKQLLRQAEVRHADQGQEDFNYQRMNEWHNYGPGVTDRDPLKWSDDKDYRNSVLKRGPGSINVIRNRSESEKSIERKLSTPISVNFKATALDAVVDQLHVMTSINFDLDLRRLKDENIDSKQPITTDLNNVSLKSALDIICRQAGLRHTIENEAIRISTAKGLAGRQTVKSLSVGDLVIPAANSVNRPGMSLADELRDAADSAYGRMRTPSNSTPRPGPGGLPNGTSAGTGSLPGIPGRLRNITPEEGGVHTNGNAEGGTLERELIRLITSTIKPDSWAEMGGEGTIEYYPLGMALVINQSPEVIEEVERLLESLRKLQDLEVSIEVKVVSLAETFFERIGVDFSMGIPTNAKPVGGPATGTTVFSTSNRNFSGNVIGLQTPGVPTPDLDIPIRATSFPRAVPPFGGFNNSFADGGISLGLAFLSDIQVQMFLEAAQGDTRTNVMQAPKLTALNGTAASMTVGDFQFFLTGIQVASVAGQLVFTPQNVPYAVGITQPIPPNASIQNGLLNFTPTAPQTPGLGLFIQPVVSADRRFVRLNIQQSFTNLISGTQQIPITTIITPVFENGGQGQPVPFTQFLQQPRFSNLETQTVVVVPDGGTVVMGGLKYMTEGRNEFGPPVLSKIPYLNRLFKNVAYGREGRSILIMVTPRVIINREEQERQTGVREDDFVGLVP
jgi:type II secretory pathway component GspD/PulD (secretin)